MDAGMNVRRPAGGIQDSVAMFSNPGGVSNVSVPPDVSIRWDGTDGQEPEGLMPLSCFALLLVHCPDSLACVFVPVR